MFTRMPPTSAYSSSLTRRQWVVPHRVRRHCPLSLSLYPLWLCNCSQLFVAHSYVHRVYIQLFAIINDNTRLAFCQVVADFLLCFPRLRLLAIGPGVGPLVTQRVDVTNQDVVFPGASNSVEHFVFRKGGKGVGILNPIRNRNDSIKDRGAIRRGAGVAHQSYRNKLNHFKYVLFNDLNMSS